MYKEMGRSDLAIDLHGRLGNWNRVIELLMETVEEKDRNDAHEKKLRAAKENLGDIYAEKFQWDTAAQVSTSIVSLTYREMRCAMSYFATPPNNAHVDFFCTLLRPFTIFV